MAIVMQIWYLQGEQIPSFFNVRFSLAYMFSNRDTFTIHKWIISSSRGENKDSGKTVKQLNFSSFSGKKKILFLLHSVKNKVKIILQGGRVHRQTSTYDLPKMTESVKHILEILQTSISDSNVSPHPHLGLLRIEFIIVPLMTDIYQLKTGNHQEIYWKKLEIIKRSSVTNNKHFNLRITKEIIIIIVVIIIIL